MDDELKGNSYKQKALDSVSQPPAVVSPGKNEIAPADDKKLPVIKGNVKQKKKSAGKVFVENFVNEDAETIKSHIVFDIVIPTVKDLIFNGFSAFLDMLLYGNTNTGVNARNQRNRGNRVVTSSGGQTNYNAISNNKRYSSGGKPQACDDIIFEERGDAIRVLDELADQIDTYGYASAYDMYDAAGLSCDYTLKNWGWYDLGSASVTRTVSGDYVINMPKMVVIK